MNYISEDNMSLAIRAAWLHYAGGMTQAAVAKRLGIPGVKAHRLINRANQEGAVKVIIEGEIADCLDQENRLMEQYGLDFCTIVPDLGEEGLPLKALGIAGSNFLINELAKNATSVIGIGHGRTLASLVDQLPRHKVDNVKFVSLLGGLTRNYSANPHDVIHRLSSKTNTQAFVMPLPFFANSIEDREVLLAQRGIQDVFNLAINSDLKLVGIGQVANDASLVSSGMVEPSEIDDVIKHGGVGEMLGSFFDENGDLVETTLSKRTLSIDVQACRNTRVVALAGGIDKAKAIRSILMSGCLAGLITDEVTARLL